MVPPGRAAPETMLLAFVVAPFPVQAAVVVSPCAAAHLAAVPSVLMRGESVCSDHVPLPRTRESCLVAQPSLPLFHVISAHLHQVCDGSADAPTMA
jgi:hypothetical protein